MLNKRIEKGADKLVYQQIMDPKETILYPLQESAPFDISKLDKLHLFTLYCSLGKCEMETIAHALIYTSLKASQWVGLRFGDIVKIDNPGWALTQVQQERAQVAFGKKCLQVIPKMPITASGVYEFTGLFGGMRETSVIGCFPASTIVGIYLLFQNGYIQIENIEGHDVIFPTAKLLENALQTVQADRKRRPTAPLEELPRQGPTQLL